MASTRSNLRTELRNELKKDPNGKIWSDSVLDTFIDKGYFKVQKDGGYDWRENEANYSFSLTSGTQEYAIPSDFGKTILVRYNGTPLLKTSKTTLKRKYTSFVNGTPSQYYTFGSNIWFDVIPNVTGTIDWDYKSINKLGASDSSESAYSEDFDAAIVLYAAFRAWSTIPEMWGVAAQKNSEYLLELDTLFSSYIFDDINDLTFWMVGRWQYTTRANVLN